MNANSKATFLKACRIEKTDFTPVWYMRQAGRFLPGYRKIREKYSMLTVLKNPELITRVTVMPVDELQVDAAIIFADILLLPMACGIDLDFVEGTGPVIKNHIKEEKDIKGLKPLQPNEIGFLLSGIKNVRAELKDEVALIGFSGMPFTLACYLIEGGTRHDGASVKAFMYQNPQTWHHLMGKLSAEIVTYLSLQVQAGVDAIQLFDSWIGCLSRQDYCEFVLPYSKEIIKQCQSLNVSIIHFGTNTTAFLPEFSSVECDVIGVDWRIPINKAWETTGFKRAIQGNLDPALLFADFEVIKKKTDEILQQVKDRPGHIFNLGHGVLPTTPVDNVKRLTEYIHNYRYES